MTKSSKDAEQGRRLLALVKIYDGGMRTDEAKIGGVGLQAIRDWVLAVDAQRLESLIAGKAPGHPSKLDDAQRGALAAVIESGSIPAGPAAGPPAPRPWRPPNAPPARPASTRPR